VTKGERLIWELFGMVRELMPVTEGNTKRFQEWSAKFHEMEVGAAQDLSAKHSDDAHQAVDTADHDADDEDDDPHEHGVPSKPKVGTRKKR